MDLGAFLVLLGTTLVVSISGVVMPGPVFAAAVVKGREGRWAGTKVALGHAVIEFPTIALVALGLRAFMESDAAQFSIALFGGLMLAVMAVEMFRTRFDQQGQITEGGRFVKGTPLVSGIITTTTNPYFFLWWATIGAALVLATLKFGYIALAIFAVVHWSIDLVWLSFVGMSVHRTKELWSQRTYKAVFWGCGALLLVFAGWFIVTAARIAL